MRHRVSGYKLGRKTGSRKALFRILVNEVESVKIKNKLPKLPVARVLLKIYPKFKYATRAWLLAGGSHHTVFSLDLNYNHLKDFCEMAEVECTKI